MLITGVLKVVSTVLVGSVGLDIVRNVAETHAANNKSPLSDVPHTVSKLQSFKRKQLLQAYSQADVPSANFVLEGDWNGALLHNNWQTLVSRLLTRLFGNFRRWNGKQFDSKNNKGYNRFERYQNERNGPNQWTVTLATYLNRSFDYAIEPSQLDGQPCIVTRYNKTDNPLMWKGMVDEIRVINQDLLIGMGSLAWGGGRRNCAPFCLYRTSSGK